jgi:hypothetical protein
VKFEQESKTSEPVIQSQQFTVNHSNQET